MRRCSSCGFRNADEANICINCGKKISKRTNHVHSGEQREITILVLSVENLATAQHLGDEEKYLIIDELMRRLVNLVYEHEGSIDKLTDDGMLVLFGIPKIHENDPERAIRAALAMILELENFNRRISQTYHADVQLRIGIHTGWIILGTMNTATETSYNIVGSTLALAAKLQMQASPNTILVSAETHKRAKSFFVFKDHPPIELKNAAESVTVFQAVDIRAFPAKVRGFFGFQSPFVGRISELSQLQSLYEKTVETNKPQVAFITGEAGMGKSRLVAEFSQAIQHKTVNIFEGRCYNYARSKPFSMMADLLRNIIRLSEASPPSQQAQAVRTYLQKLGVQTNEIFPYVMEILGLSTEDNKESHQSQLDGAVLERLIFAALRRLLITEAEKAPLILVLEDLHWIDAASHKFLRHLLQTVTNQPIIWLLISRHTENEHILYALKAATGQHNPLDIFLNPLSAAETNSLVETLMQCNLPKSDQVLGRLATRAAGNPFFVEEIVRTLIEQGILIREGDAWVLKSADDTSLFNAVPNTLHGLIMARYDRLEPAVQQTLRIGAVLGTSFSVNILYACNNLHHETLKQHLMELVGRSFLVKDESTNHESYRFSHTLFQEVIYKILLSRDRQKLHYHAAKIYSQSPEILPEERNEALAFHYFHSLNPQKALPHLLAAADYAVRRSANEVAAQYFRQALSLMEDNAEPSEQIWLTQLKLGQALKFIGQYSEASKILDTALQQLLFQSLKITSQTILPVLVNALRELADIRVREGKIDEAITHLQAGLDALSEGKTQRHSELWFLLIERLAWVRFRQGNLDEAFSLANWATMESESYRDESHIVLASLFNTLAGIFWRWGNQTKAATYISLSLDHYKKLGYAWGMATAYANLGVLYSSQGLWQKALRYLEEAYALYKENGYIPELSLNLYNLGLLRQSMGDHAQAKRDFIESLKISRHLGNTFAVASANIGLGYQAFLDQDLPTANQHIDAVLSLENNTTEEQIVQANWIKGLVQAEQGDAEAGIETIKRALTLAQSAHLTEQEAKSRRALGMLHTRIGHYLDAEIVFREAIDQFLQANIPYWQAMTLLEMGKMYQKRAELYAPTESEWLEKAEQAIQEALQHFDHLGAAYDRQQAENTLQTVQDAITIRQSQYETAPTIAQQTDGVPQSHDAAWHTVAILWLKLTPPAIADEESIFEAMATVIPELTAFSNEFQGKLTRRHDGLMVVFGAPVAFEDDAERAVNAAVQMLNYLKTFSKENDIRLDFGASVSLGKVIAGQMGSQHHSEFVVRGEIVQLSQQLAQLVPKGNIWVTDSVREATERTFHYRKISPEKNTSFPYEILWEFDHFKSDPMPARGMPGIRAKLVGRTEILEKMFVLTEQLPQGIGGLIWIEGEPGIGKSRLMKEFVEATVDEKTILWSGKCSPQKNSQAFSVFIDLLTKAFNTKTNDSPEVVREQIDYFYASLPSTVQMTRPYIETLLGISPSGAGGQRLLSLEPQQLRQQIFVAFRRLFQGILRQQPMVIVLDDLHWVDPISAELIQFLMTLVATSPILFVCAQRRQGGDSPNDRLVKTQSLMPLQTMRFRLERLSPAESKILIQDLLPNIELTEKLCQLILSRSEGNPYFIEEFVRMLIEHDYFQRQNGRWHVNAEIQIDVLALPSSLETLIRSRIDALPPELQQVMYAAVVVDDPFDVPLLEALVSPNEINRALARLESRLLVRRGLTEDEWFFNHSLIQTVTYQAILKNQRQALHRAVASTLSTRWGEHAAEHAETLAYHFSQAEDKASALPYLILAGERAAARFANDESLDYFRQAEEILATSNIGTANLQWRTAIGIGDIYRSLGKYDESITAFQTAQSLLTQIDKADARAMGLYRRWGETARKQGNYPTAIEKFQQVLSRAQSSIDTAELKFERVRTLTGLAWVYLVQGKFELAQQTAETSLSEAKKIDAIGEMAAAENLLGGLFYRKSDWTLALHHTMRAMVFREQVGYSWGVAGSLSNLGILAVSAGHWDKARSFFERSSVLRDEMGDVEGMAIVYNNLGTLARDQGELEIAEQYFRKSLAIAIPFKISWHVVNSTVGLTQVLLLQEKFDEAHIEIESSLTQAEAIGAEDIKVEILYVQAELLLAKSALTEAKQTAEKALTQAKKVGNHILESSAWRIIATVERQYKHFTDAWQAIGKADALLAESTDELEIARTTYEKGRIALDEGDEAHAREHFRFAKEVFMRLGANLDSENIEELLKEAFRI